MGYRELGLLSVFIMWCAFAFLLTRWRNKHSMSISLHAASARNAFYFFASTLVISGTMFTIFMLQWFIPELALPEVFRYLFFITMLCFFATAVIPDIKGFYHKLHAFFAFSMAGMLFVLIVCILTSCSLSWPTQLIGGAALAYMVFCAVSYLLVRKKPNHFIMRNYVRFQVFYLVSFQIFILAATYLG